MVYGFLINGTDKLKRFYEVEDGDQVHSRLYCFMRGDWSFDGKFVNLLKYILIYAVIIVAFQLAILVHL